jgi:hypothetical protein
MAGKITAKRNLSERAQLADGAPNGSADRGLYAPRPKRPKGERS